MVLPMMLLHGSLNTSGAKESPRMISTPVTVPWAEVGAGGHGRNGPRGMHWKLTALEQEQPDDLPTKPPAPVGILLTLC